MSPSRAALVLIWWPLLDLNQRPADYESVALTAELRGRVRYGILTGSGFRHNMKGAQGCAVPAWFG